MKDKTEAKEEKEIKLQVYEIGYLLVSTIAEGDVSEKVDVIRKEIESVKGQIVAQGDPVLRDLAYEMSIVVSNKKEIHGSGYFGWIKFEGDCAQVKKINDKLEKNTDIIRFIVIKTVSEDTFAIIEKTLASEAEEISRAAIKEKEKVLELKNKERKEKETMKEKEKAAEPISKEEIDETIDKLIAE